MLLHVDSLAVTYGGAVQALRGASVDVPAAGVVALLGNNGAGKTTLLRALSGTLPLHGGRVVVGTVSFDGRSSVGMSAATLVRAGISHVPEGRRVFPGMTVEDNLRAGGLAAPGPRQRAQARTRVLDLFPVLADRRRQPAGLLSGGEQQMLAIGRALMACPKLLLLDEPSLGLAPLMVQRVAQAIRDINASGTAIALVEQNAQMALSLAQKVVVLDVGQTVLTGLAAEVAAGGMLEELLLGRPVDPTTPKAAS
ncbi:ABC transporter ATP-binding protein [Micromonospora echinofusca]|uniref:ATP-binding cassette domain-containing protein n=1 Tax=Micromonospora echinofusca TaxID=47858 RepID=A0ABS3VVV1_MICEH|nr:ABC transporter ATP-binding protein [Micromonospora echinofusca]MBO4208533.1 ATP-binding cassette domain-containing protein [Micromonospora echinofusca]